MFTFVAGLQLRFAHLLSSVFSAVFAFIITVDPYAFISSFSIIEQILTVNSQQTRHHSYGDSAIDESIPTFTQDDMI